VAGGHYPVPQGQVLELQRLQQRVGGLRSNFRLLDVFRFSADSIPACRRLRQRNNCDRAGPELALFDRSGVVTLRLPRVKDDTCALVLAFLSILIFFLDFLRSHSWHRGYFLPWI